MDCIYIAPLSKALYNFCLSFTHSHTHIHTPTAIGCHARYQPARQEQLGVRCLAQGHFDTPGVESNRQPSDCQTTALPPEPHRPLCAGTDVWVFFFPCSLKKYWGCSAPQNQVRVFLGGGGLASYMEKKMAARLTYCWPSFYTPFRSYHEPYGRLLGTVLTAESWLL